MEIERQAKIVDDPIIAEYVNRVGQNLVRNSDCKVPVTIKVIDTDEPNAMALPGGFFFVNTGLITLAENESRDRRRHGPRDRPHRRPPRHQAGHPRPDRQPRHHPADLHGRLDRLRHPAGRLDSDPDRLPDLLPRLRAEADLLGLQYMYKAGYDPNGFVDFFERLESMEKRKPGTISKVFRSHPPTGDRITTAQKNIAELLKEKPEYVITTSEFDDVKDRLLAMNNRRKVGATPKIANRPRLKKAPGGQHRARRGRRQPEEAQGRVRRAADPEAPQLTAAVSRPLNIQPL